MAENNMYSASAAEVRALFDGYVDGAPSALALVLSERALGEEARSAFEKSFAALGYGRKACAFAVLESSEAEGAVALDAQALFMLIEGLDPVSLVCADERSAAAVEACYREKVRREGAGRVFGRPTAAFASFESMLASDEGKQRAWHVLKSLPRMDG